MFGTLKLLIACCLLARSGQANPLVDGSVDWMVLPTVGNDTIPSQRALSRKFGDDVYRDIGCQSGMFMSLKSYLTRLGMDTTADFLGEMKTFKTDEGRTEVTYFDFGPFQQQSDTEEQKAVLFLAGLGSLMRSWSPSLLQGLAANQRVVMLDYPGQGTSKVTNHTDNPLPQYTIEWMADTSMKLLDHLGLGQGQTSVIGRSMGSLVCLQMAVAHGDRLNKIIPVSNVILNTAARSGELFKLAKTSLEQTKIYYPITTGCDVGQWLCYKQEFTELYRKKKDMSFKTNSKITELQRVALNQYVANNQTEAFRRIENPVLAIQGELDTTAPVSNLIVLGNYVKNFRWQLFKKAGHAVTDEYVDYLVMSIQSFLSDINWEKNPEGPDGAGFSDGVWPGQNWYWRPYGAGGSCLNPVLNCNPPTEDGLPTEAPAENENGAKVPGSLLPGSSRGAPAKVGLAAAVPPQIAVAGSGLESLKLMLDG